MANKKGVRCAVVVEDARLATFVRESLECLGMGSRDFRIVPGYPKDGGGSGKQYVEQQYEKELRTLREKAHQNLGLILGTEADEQPVTGPNSRTQKLDAIFSDTRGGHREPNDPIVYWIPKRQIETWGLHLTGSTVDEETDYHNKGRNIDWKRAAQQFHAGYLNFKQAIPATLPSLQNAFQETVRVI